MKIPRGEGLGLAYPVLWTICRIALGIYLNIKVEGLDNIPGEGAAIVSPNHRSALDPPLVSILLKRPLFHMAKAELFKSMGWLIGPVGAYPVKRGTADMRAMRRSITLLRGGHLICVFPEGTRSQDGLGTVRRGAEYLAAHVGVPVVPVGISGQYGLRRVISIRIGKPMVMVGDEKDSDRIMEAISALGAPTTVSF